MKPRILPLIYVLGLAAVVALVASQKKSHDGGAPPATTAPGTASLFKVVDGRSVGSPIPASLADQFSGKNAYAHVKTLCEIGPRPPQSEGFHKALKYVEQKFAEAGWTTRPQTFTTKGPGGIPVTFTNLLARFHPTEASWNATAPEVIAGHFDSKLMTAFHFVGANDGGSSTGIMLEMARVLAADPATASQFEFVLFDGEEALGGGITATDGLYGSKYYAQQLSQKQVLPSYAVVLDLVGDEHTRFFFNPEASPAMASAVTAAAKKYSLDLGLAEGSIIDDHVPLMNAQVTCLHIIGDFMNMPYWHKEGDTLDVISPEALEKTGRVTLSALAAKLP